MSKTWKIIIAVVIIAVVAGGGVYLWRNKVTEPASETRSLADCSKLGTAWDLFSDNKTTLSFCYKNLWGIIGLKETEISPEARIGTSYYVSFAPKSGIYLPPFSPLISYETLDYRKTGDSDVPPEIAWKMLDFSKSETELALLVHPDEYATAQKLLVNGKQVLKLHRNRNTVSGPFTSVSYFMPNVVINGTTYNLKITCAPEQEADVDKLLESMTF